jgi:hypothetical protein
MKKILSIFILTFLISIPICFAGRENKHESHFESGITRSAAHWKVTESKFSQYDLSGNNNDDNGSGSLRGFADGQTPGTTPGVGVPVGSSLFLLLILTGLYGIWTVLSAKNKSRNAKE